MDLLNIINTNKVVSGLAMIAMNFGSRYLLGDITEFQENALKSNLAKQFVLLCIFFVSTRDIMISLMLTFAFSFIVFGVLNHKRAINLFVMTPEKDLLDGYSDYVKKIQILNRCIK